MASRYGKLLGIDLGVHTFMWNNEWHKSPHSNEIWKRFKVLEFSTNPLRLPGRRSLHLQIYFCNMGIAIWAIWNTQPVHKSDDKEIRPQVWEILMKETSI